MVNFRELRRLCELLMDREFDIVNKYSMDTPHFVFNKMKDQAEKHGFVFGKVEEGRDFFLLKIKTPYDEVINVKIGKHELVSNPEADIQDFINRNN